METTRFSVVFPSSQSLEDSNSNFRVLLLSLCKLTCGPLLLEHKVLLLCSIFKLYWQPLDIRGTGTNILCCGNDGGASYHYQQTLEENLGKRVNSFTIIPGTKFGDNYMSVLYSIDVQLCGNDKVTLNLISKCYPSHPVRQEFLNKSNMFWNELIHLPSSHSGTGEILPGVGTVEQIAISPDNG